MLYLVTGEFVDPGPLLQPQALVHLIENLVIPSFQALAKLQREGKVRAGGLHCGRRAGAFIVDVGSNRELDELLMGLPFWGIVKWEVIPMESFEDREVVERQMLEHIKTMAG